MNKEFWSAALRRAIRTTAQAALASIGANAVTLGDVDIVATLSAAALGFILSMLMSIATGLPEAPFYTGEVDSNDK